MLLSYIVHVVQRTSLMSAVHSRHLVANLLEQTTAAECKHNSILSRTKIFAEGVVAGHTDASTRQTKKDQAEASGYDRRSRGRGHLIGNAYDQFLLCWTRRE